MSLDSAAQERLAEVHEAERRVRVRKKQEHAEQEALAAVHPTSRTLNPVSTVTEPGVDPEDPRPKVFIDSSVTREDSFRITKIDPGWLDYIVECIKAKVTFAFARTGATLPC